MRWSKPKLRDFGFVNIHVLRYQTGKYGKILLKVQYYSTLESCLNLEQNYILKFQILQPWMKGGFLPSLTLTLSLPKWCSLTWVRILKSDIKATQKPHWFGHKDVFHHSIGKFSFPVIWDSLSYDFRLIISFRRDKLKVILPVLSAWRQISHPCPENNITDTSDKSTWCTFETQPSTPDSAKTRRKYANRHLSPLRPDPDFSFLHAELQTNGTNALWSQQNSTLLMALAWRTAQASLTSFSESIVLVACTVIELDKKGKITTTEVFALGVSTGGSAKFSSHSRTNRNCELSTTLMKLHSKGGV